MGLFGKKAMYKYKPLERVRINIDAVNNTFLATNPKLSSYEAKEYCELVGETNNYRIYVYQRKVSGFDGYFLRQEKSSPKRVAYLGTARKHCCVFHDKLFTINSLSATNQIYHPLICKDINTGVQTELKILSEKGFHEFVGTSMHLYCQDVVHSLEVHNDVMTLEVYRYPADSILTRETYHEECIYHIHIKHDNGKFFATKEFPKTKAEPETTRENNTQKDENASSEQSAIKSVVSFYNDCVADFHKEAGKYGVANKGVIFIPELLPLGEKTILAFLQDQFFQVQFGNDAQTYYYVIMSLAIDAGIVYATRWHEQFSTLNSYVDEIIETGPADDANLLLSKYFSEEISTNQGNQFFQKIFPRWIAMHEPYWELSDPRDYTFKAMLAAYQLGISMILEKYGY